MDVNGKSLSGNGRWGRFATIEGASGEMWFCENEIERIEEAGVLSSAVEQTVLTVKESGLKELLKTLATCTVGQLTFCKIHSIKT